MEKVIGGVLGLAAFLAVVIYGADQGFNPYATFVQGVCALAVGWGLGRWVLGPLGLQLLDHAPPSAPEPPKAAEKEVQGGTPKAVTAEQTKA